MCSMLVCILSTGAYHGLAESHPFIGLVKQSFHLGPLLPNSLPDRKSREHLNAHQQLRTRDKTPVAISVLLLYALSVNGMSVGGSAVSVRIMAGRIALLLNQI